MRLWPDVTLNIDLSLREVRLLVIFGYHTTVAAVVILLLLVGHSIGVLLLVDAGIFLALAHIVSFRRMPVDQWLQERLIRRWRCRDCGMEITLLTGRWRCPSCSFISSPRSALSPCPGGCEGKRAFAWIVCPGCGTGIPI